MNRVHPSAFASLTARFACDRGPGRDRQDGGSASLARTAKRRRVNRVHPSAFASLTATSIGASLRHDPDDLVDEMQRALSAPTTIMRQLSALNEVARTMARVVIATGRGGDDAVLTVADDGRGVRQEDLPKVFEPGFTRWTVGVGAGLGLSTCLRIVSRPCGRIDIDSTEGHGNTVTVRIPIGGSRSPAS